MESPHTPEFFDPSKVKPDIDPSIGHFKYSESDREKMRQEGLTDDDIKQREDDISNRIAKAA